MCVQRYTVALTKGVHHAFSTLNLLVRSMNKGKGSYSFVYKRKSAVVTLVTGTGLCHCLSSAA